MDQKEFQKLVDELQTKIDETAQRWLDEQKLNITGEVNRILNEQRDSIIFSLLGFRYSYGKWEVDHCNNRSGNSAAGDFLREKATPAVNAWLTAQATKLPKLKKEIVKSLKEEYLKLVERYVKDGLYRHAEKEAKAILDTFKLKYDMTPKDGVPPRNISLKL